MLCDSKLVAGLRRHNKAEQVAENPLILPLPPRRHPLQVAQCQLHPLLAALHPLQPALHPLRAALCLLQLIYPLLIAPPLLRPLRRFLRPALCRVKCLNLRHYRQTNQPQECRSLVHLCLELNHQWAL